MNLWETVRTTLIVCVTVFLSMLFVIVVIFVLPKNDKYSTTDVADYGNYIGNYDDRRAAHFINCFFPEKIEEYFTDVDYSYRAQEGDICAFEAYLEFVIEDSKQYKDFVDEHIGNLTGGEFFYDPRYTEYVYNDRFDVSGYDQLNPKEQDINIAYSEIAKILCNDEEQRIIFVALGVYDGGTADTGFLGVFFDRFEIDPRKYEASPLDPDVWEGGLSSFELGFVESAKRKFEIIIKQYT